MCFGIDSKMTIVIFKHFTLLIFMQIYAGFKRIMINFEVEECGSDQSYTSQFPSTINPFIYLNKGDQFFFYK